MVGLIRLQLLSSLSLALASLATDPIHAEPVEASAAATKPAESLPAEAFQRWDPPRKRISTPVRDELRGDWNPLSGPTKAAKGKLEDVGITLDANAAFYYQGANETLSGKQDLGTFAWLVAGKQHLVRSERLGNSELGWLLLGSPGLNYDTSQQTLSANVGSISGLNANVYPDPAALDELYLEQVSQNKRFLVMVGRIDQSFYFDTNRVANNSYEQFFSFALENDLSIPWPLYGGLGFLVRFQPKEGFYIMAGGGDAGSVDPWAFWNSLDDGDWYGLVEAGFSYRVPRLGRGNARVTPWYRHLGGENGFGFGLNFDQELGLDHLVAFFRVGIGEEKFTTVKHFVSGGLAFEKPFHRKNDWAALGVAWSDPSPGNGSRSETLLELVYRLALSPSVLVSPNLQLVFDPAQSPSNDLVVVGGLRINLTF